jgi:hypothetical protein
MRMARSAARTAKKLRPLKRKHQAGPFQRKAGNSGTNHAGAVEDGRIQGDGIGEIFADDHLHEKSLANGDVEGVDDADQESDDDNFPNGDGLGEGKRGKSEGQQHGNQLSDDDAVVAVVAVADVTADGSQK